MNSFAGFVGTSPLDGYKMTPLLTDEEISMLLIEMPVNREGICSYFARSIEKLATERAYRRAAEVCEQATIQQFVLYSPGHYIDPNKLGEIYKAQSDRCSDAILKLMEEC